MTEQAAQFVGSIPEHYDQGLGPQLFFAYADDLAQRAAALAPTSVLELAAGTGIVSRRLRDALPNACNLVATDLNQPMLEVAKAKFEADELVQFEQADATDLRFDDASFDLVACQFGVMFFPDKLRSYEEALRVLQPGGSYIFNVWGSWDDNPFAEIVHNCVATLFPDDPPGFYKVPFGYHDEREIRQAILQAGFTEVAFETVSRHSKISSAEVFARGLVFGNPLFDEVVSRGGDADAICDAVATAIEQQLGAEMPLAALVIHATKT